MFALILLAAVIECPDFSGVAWVYCVLGQIFFLRPTNAAEFEEKNMRSLFFFNKVLKRYALEP